MYHKAMTPEQFTYWLQGFVELTDSDETAILDAPQWAMIKDHLKEVFHKVTPKRVIPHDLNKEFVPNFNPQFIPATPNYIQPQTIC